MVNAVSVEELVDELERALHIRIGEVEMGHPALLSIMPRHTHPVARKEVQERLAQLGRHLHPHDIRVGRRHL